MSEFDMTYSGIYIQHAIAMPSMLCSMAIAVMGAGHFVLINDMLSRLTASRFDAVLLSLRKGSHSLYRESGVK